MTKGKKPTIIRGSRSDKAAGTTYSDEFDDKLDLNPPEPVQRLSKDIKVAAKSMTPQEVRYLIDLYYMMQRNRIRATHQWRQLVENKEPYAVLDWTAEQAEVLEGQIKRAISYYVKENPRAEWIISVPGIGPIICAGLLAHIDITKIHWPSQLWSFAGLNPRAKWKKGEKRPWNGRLKVLCWTAGESFVKVSKRPNDYYGHILAARKQFLEEANAAGELAHIAKNKMVNLKRDDTTVMQTLKTGKLPQFMIHNHARWWTVRLFMSHVFEWLWECEYPGEAVPKPWVIAHRPDLHMDYVRRPTFIKDGFIGKMPDTKNLSRNWKPDPEQRDPWPEMQNPQDDVEDE